ncbi:MAG: hypothetical protein NXI20_21990 [bacterium]|nr:hypothetical protein [bacterium]
MKKICSIILFSVLALTFGCDDDEFMAGDLTIETKKSSVVLRNGASESIYFIILERNAVAYVDWIPTINEENAIESGESEKIEYDDILGYDEDAEELMIYYWKAIEEGGELVPGPIDNVTVPLD